MADLDLLDLLAADHVNLRTDVTGPEAVAAVEKHLTVERALLYPTLRSHLGDGRASVDELRTIDNTLVDALARGDGAVDGETAVALEAHIGAQEAHYAELRQAVPATKLRELGDQVPWVLAEAPTHLHPHLPDHGPLREVAAELAAAADQYRDDI
jgi:hypothetical protein